MSNFLSPDGIAPAVLREIAALEDLTAYPTVDVRPAPDTSCERAAEGTLAAVVIDQELLYTNPN